MQIAQIKSTYIKNVQVSMNLTKEKWEKHTKIMEDKIINIKLVM